MKTTLTLAALKEDSWFTDLEHSSTLVRLYPSINVPHDIISRAYKHRLRLLNLEPPVKVGLIQVHGGDLSDLKIVYHSEESGVLSISLRTVPLELPVGAYSYFSSPLNVDGRVGDLSACRKSIDVASSLLICLIGRAFAYAQVFEQEVSLNDGKAHGRALSHTIGSTSDQGPFISQGNWQLGAAICTAMREASAEMLNRLDLSFNFLTKAIELREAGFFEYWTALEVLCGGPAPKIRARVQRTYEWKRPHDVDEILGFDKVSKMRHDMVHKGIVPDMMPCFQRYMHLLFIDVLCCTLGIRTGGLLLSYIREASFDTSFGSRRAERVEGEMQKPLTAQAVMVEKENLRRSWMDLLDRLGH